MENYLVSARKYRPSTFDSVVGQKALTATLKNAIATNRLASSYLFCGSRGVGKTSCARIFAKTINCLNPTPDGEACNNCDSCRDFNNGVSLNIIELDAASNNGVDDIRQLVEQVQVRPTQGRYRVFIVDEVHMLSSSAFNAFLKTLEEPPSYVIFILATTEKHKIIPTILSRCQIFDFKRITIADMMGHLAFVAEKEGIKAEKTALNVIARKADGAMRDALSIFDQVAASSRGNITYQSAIENLNVLDNNYYNRLLDCFLEGRVLDSWLIYKEIRDHGFDSHFFIIGLADYLRDLMVAMSPSTMVLLETDDETRKAMAERAARCKPEFIYKAMNLCNDADLNYRAASNKQFLIELTLAKICQLLSPSPQNDGEGEGRLQKINVSNSVQKSESAPRAQTQPTPAPQTVPPASPSTSISAEPPIEPLKTPKTPLHSAPQVVSAGARRPLKRPNSTFSINKHGAQAHDEPKAAAGPEPQLRNAPFSDEDLGKVWQEFIDLNPTRHILINAMRASFPVKKDAFSYRMTVENEMQRGVIEQESTELLRYVRDSLNNDSFTLEIEINQGQSSPHTWSEREVLDHMLETVPELRLLIDTMSLTIG